MQQPPWITLLTAQGAVDATAKASLLGEIQERIGYYVHDRTTRFEQLDVYNESYHTGSSLPAANYWTIYGPAGIADIYNQVGIAAQQGGVKNLKLFTNEYNVLCDGNDAYGNWYREHLEMIRSNNGNLGGVGIQYYSHKSIGIGNSAHNASRVFGALNNLAVTNLSLELTEFGNRPPARCRFPPSHS
jgi:hypothetical protein